MRLLDAAMLRWQNEVDAETITLIETGMAPWEAGARAVVIVSNRRRDKYADKSGS